MSGDCPPCQPPYTPPTFADEIHQAVNDARALEEALGLRPYRLLAVRQHWSGGEIGRGDVTRVFTRELSPRPRVYFRMRNELTAAGVVSRSTVIVREINPALTEPEVLELFSPVLTDPADEAYLELFVDPGTGVRRRYVVSEPLERLANEWRCELREQQRARGRAGEVRYPGQR